LIHVRVLIPLLLDYSDGSCKDQQALRGRFVQLVLDSCWPQPVLNA
jgi:hypothetical protein